MPDETDYKWLAEMYEKTMKAYQSENAKLRELVSKAWGCVNRPFSCYECGVAHGGCTLRSAMRELGIEVTK